MYMPTFPLTVRVPRVRSSFVGHSIIPISYPRNRALPVWAWVISVFSADRVSFSSVARNVDILSLIWWASTKGPANPRRKSSAYLTYRNLLYPGTSGFWEGYRFIALHMALILSKYLDRCFPTFSAHNPEQCHGVTVAQNVAEFTSRYLEWAGSRLRVVETDGRHVTPTHVTDEIASTPSDEVPMLPAVPVRPAPEAERRQLTVLFCDLVGSTQLSGQLDPEDLRTVVRAYQEAAAVVIQSYEGHIAQYLGDGLLVYFGYPTAHEDDARRAVHTGLGIVQTIATLNTHLAAQYDVQLAVRLGIHTGPVVVGVMGGGGRHEHLALGETPNIAARLEALAPANTVVISAVTARLVQGVFALEDLGTHTLHGVAEPLALSRVRGLLATPSRDEEFFP